MGRGIGSREVAWAVSDNGAHFGTTSSHRQTQHIRSRTYTSLLQREPQRLSALYQYHNAPEVAPAHGLEYDDTNYPSSDKYPVVHSSGYDSSKYSGKHAYSDNRPPRIIFGMKVPTFLVVAGIIVLIVVGAAVGGAVGGKSMRENQSQVVAAMIK